MSHRGRAFRALIAGSCWRVMRGELSEFDRVDYVWRALDTFEGSRGVA